METEESKREQRISDIASEISNIYTIAFGAKTNEIVDLVLREATKSLIKRLDKSDDEDDDLGYNTDGDNDGGDDGNGGGDNNGGGSNNAEPGDKDDASNKKGMSTIMTPEDILKLISPDVLINNNLTESQVLDAFAECQLDSMESILQFNQTISEKRENLLIAKAKDLDLAEAEQIHLTPGRVVYVLRPKDEDKDDRSIYFPNIGLLRTTLKQKRGGRGDYKTMSESRLTSLIYRYKMELNILESSKSKLTKEDKHRKEWLKNKIRELLNERSKRLLSDIEKKRKKRSNKNQLV